MDHNDEEKLHVAILKGRLAPTLSMGGVEKYTMRVAKAFVEAGCRVTLLTTPPKRMKSQPRSFSLPFDVVSFEGCNSTFSYHYLRQFDKKCLEWITSHQPDIVLGMDRNTYQTHYRAGNGVHRSYLARRYKAESFFKRLSFRFNPLHRTILDFEKKTYEDPRLKALIVNSTMVMDEIKEYYTTPPDKIHVIHNGVEWNEMLNRFTLWPAVSEERVAQLGLASNTYRYLFIGNDFRRKGLELLLRSLSRMTQNDFHLLVVGQDKESEKFKSFTQHLGLAQHVTFFGPQRDLTPFYQVADCLVLPSLYDPFANVTVEALAMGLIVVTSIYNGGKEVITPETGMIIEDLWNIESLSHSLAEAMKRPKTIASANAIRSSVQKLDFSSQLDKMVDTVMKTHNAKYNAGGKILLPS